MQDGRGRAHHPRGGYPGLECQSKDCGDTVGQEGMVRDTSLKLITDTDQMHDEQQLPFRGFVGPIVECLEDADGTVRDTAKNSLVDLFR